MIIRAPSEILYSEFDDLPFQGLLNLGFMLKCGLDETALYFQVFQSELKNRALLERDITRRKGSLRSWYH